MTNNILFDNADENNGMPNFFVPSVQARFYSEFKIGTVLKTIQVCFIVGSYDRHLC